MRLLVFVLLILTASYSFSQKNSLKGVVTGSDDRDGIVGVNILVKGTIHGTVSGLHGDFLLTDIPNGEQTIIFSFLGYEPVEKKFNFDRRSLDSCSIELVKGSYDLGAVNIEARKPFSAASSKSIRDFDLKIKPKRSAQDILSLVPGLIIAQHAGGGKAEQIFMRGFDADHGTDVGVYVDGIPVNMVSHGHGQGYADLHFIIPEIIDGLSVYKGPYFGQFGNFGTAGSVQLKTTDHPAKNLIKLEGGMFNTSKFTTVLKIPTNASHQSAYIAAQHYKTNGAFERPQNLNRSNIFGKFHTHLTENSELSFGMGAFASAWDASGQIPERAIKSGLITRWGDIDPFEGGVTSRMNFSLDYHFFQGFEHDFVVQTYFTKYDFKLYSDFTFWLNDPIHGDMIEQNDHRTIYGINSNYSINKTLGSVESITKIGSSFRNDRIDVSLWKSPERNRLSVQTDAKINEINSALWAIENLIFSSKFKAQFSLRADYFSFDVVDKLDYYGFEGNNLPHASGYTQAFVVNPKMNLVFSPAKNWDLFMNFGNGFHSNDARDVILAKRINEIIKAGQFNGLSDEEINTELANKNFDIQQKDIKTLPKATGFEIGTKIAVNDFALLSVAGWYLHMNEELVFVGDEGTTEISGETQRIGIDSELRIQLAKWIWADLDLNLANGKYVNEPDGMNHIPLAPKLTSQGGLNFKHKKGFDGAIRFRFVGDRPANESNTVVAKGYFLNNLILGYHLGNFYLNSQIENVFNTQWNEAQFDTESRLKNELNPISEIHFTPGNPLNIQFGISYEF